MAALDRTITSTTPGLSRSLLLAPPVAALCYPLLLKVFHAAVTRDSGANVPLATIALVLALSVPAISVYVYAKLAALRQLTVVALRLKWIALLSIATFPFYTTIGVLLYAVQDPISDIVVWIALWGPLIAAAAHAAFSDSVPAPLSPGVATDRLRMAHGTSAALILLLFLALHLSNHLVGLWSVAAHRHVMDLFRLAYRSRFIEPLVIALFLFQVVSGVRLLLPYVRRPTDLFRTVQVATGAYLLFYVLGHLNSVLVARVITKTMTDWDWATGAPDGLIHSAWSIRLLPHYLTAVFFVLSHLVLGARVVALAHNAPRQTVDSLAKVGIGVAAIVAAAIMMGLVGLHVAN